jgi:RNA polymerase sigma-70 factor (ECF subfamily)
VNLAVCHPPDLEALYRAHRARVLRLCRLLLDDPDEAADVAHDVFLRVDLACRRESPPEDWPAWIAKVTVNACWDRRRSGWWRWWRRAGVEIDGETVPGPASTPEQESIRREQHARVWSALRRLPARQREVFVLRHVEDLPTATVAAALGIASGSVKRHLFRAIRTLRGALGDQR